MRAFLGALSIALAVLVSGCTIIDKELNNRGGYLDYLADDWFKADSKKMRVVRAVALEVTLARLSIIAPKSNTDRDLLARRIGDASQQGIYAASCAFAAQPCFYFDSIMVDYVGALYQLALAALPIDDAHKLLNRLEGDIVGTNPVDLMFALIDLGREAVRYGQVAGAIYRDTVEMEVQVWLDTPKQNKAGGPGANRVTEDTVKALREIYDRGNDDLEAWKVQLASLHAQGLEPIPSWQLVSRLFGLVRFLCGQITNNKSALDACRMPLGTAPGKLVLLPPLPTAKPKQLATLGR